LSGELVNNKTVYNKFYSNYYFLDEFIVVDILDTTVNIPHPDLAKIIKADKWYIDENMKFKLDEK
jgi:hypothetical protein